MDSTIKFDIDIVGAEFRQSYTESCQLKLDAYIRGYEQLNKFVKILGRVFHFVALKIGKHIAFLRKLQQINDNNNHYETIEAMLAHELQQLAAYSKKTGCHKLLQLHRGLPFAVSFIEEMILLPADSPVHAACLAAYDLNLKEYHPRLVQRMARYAMLSLPTKKELYRRMDVDMDLFDAQLAPRAATALKEIYHRTQDIYERHFIFD